MNVAFLSFYKMKTTTGRDRVWIRMFVNVTQTNSKAHANCEKFTFYSFEQETNVFPVKKTTVGYSTTAGTVCTTFLSATTHTPPKSRDRLLLLPQQRRWRIRLVTGILSG